MDTVYDKREKIDYAWPVTSEHSVVLQRLRAELERLASAFSGKRVVLFGAGIRGCCLLHLLEQRSFRDIVFCDNNPEKQKGRIRQYDIVSLDEALRYDAPQIFFVTPENSGVMGRQLTDAGLTEGSNWYSFDVSGYDAYAEEYVRPVSDHLLVLGDCAFTHIALTDDNTSSVGEMLKAELGEKHCKVLAMHGMGTRAYFHIIHSLIDKNERPALLVLLLVLEVLAPKAHLMPRTQHPALLRMLTAAAANPNQEFLTYVDLAEERFKKFQTESFASFQSAQKEVNEKLYMQMNYLFKIKEETEGVVYLKKILKTMNDASIPVVLYVPPVNYEQGERFFGDAFRARYMENFTKLYDFLDKEGLCYRVADASFLLTGHEFAAPNTIDETANYEGRSKVLKFLMENEQLRPLVKKEHFHA